ncbi:hypothetical protein Tco_1106430 [Tanacetum coccineum]
MATMAENIIAVGSETRPPMLEKGMYDSWKTQIILYIRGKENGEMLKVSVDNGPYQFKSEITVKDTNGVTDIRIPQRLEELDRQDTLRYDSDIKAVNILLLGLPVDIYTLINHYQTAKEIWDRVKELMEGTKMAKQERESMLYDEFDKFTFEPEESIHSYYLSYAPTVVRQPPTYQPDTGLAIPTFLPSDDPIESLNKAMIFLSSVYRLKFPPTNNQLQTSSNLRTQAIIPKGQVTVQNVQGHMAKQCTARKGVKDSDWFMEKMLLAQAH